MLRQEAPKLFGAFGAFALCLVALAVAVLPSSFQEDDSVVDGVVTVRTTRGIVSGKFVQLPNGHQVRVFLGIPFAEPPVGELRFKAPVAKKPWKGILNATSFGSICYQRSTQRVWDIEEVSGRKMLKQKKLKEFAMSEDCLTLNVYVPQMSETSTPLTVLVYLHGGSYCMNGGRLYPGEKLASMGAIVVTLNYRLGPLGFLCTEDSVAPGNYGLLDQVEALRWVQDNIAAFGGDAADVAIFGNSAGGASVTFHMLSQLSEGLFSSAMAQSGCANAPWALQLQPLTYVLKLAKNLACPTQPTTDMIDCIRTFSADLVVKKAPMADGLLVPFAPVIDGKYGGYFLTDHPNTLLRNGNFHGAHVPFLTGVTKDEVSIWFTTEGPELDIEQMRSFIQKRAKELLKDKHVTELNHAAVMHAIDVQYLIKRGITQTKGKGHTMAVIDFISDVGIKAPCVQFLQNLVERSSATLYMYEFGYFSRDDARSERHDWIGAYHESELQYLFGEPHLNYTNSLRLETDKAVSDFMMNMWINFAKYGNPTPTSHNPLNVTWKPYTTQHHAHLHVVDNPRMEENYQTESILFFNAFLPILSDHPLHDTKRKCHGKGHRKWVVWTLSATVGVLAVLCAVLCVCTCRQRAHRAHRTFVTTNSTKHAPLSPENSTAV